MPRYCKDHEFTAYATNHCVGGMLCMCLLIMSTYCQRELSEAQRDMLLACSQGMGAPTGTLRDWFRF